MLSTTSPMTAPPKISVILAAGQPSSCRPTTDRGCKRPFKEPPLTAESGGATRAALLAMRAHRGTGSSNPLPSSGESANFRFLSGFVARSRLAHFRRRARRHCLHQKPQLEAESRRFVSSPVPSRRQHTKRRRLSKVPIFWAKSGVSKVLNFATRQESDNPSSEELAGPVTGRSVNFLS